MTGRMELHQETNGRYRVKLVDDLRNILAVSTEFESKKAALDGIFTLREIAGTAHISYCNSQENTAEHALRGPTPESLKPLLPTTLPKEFWPNR